MMHPKVARALEEIDAAVFSGDTFHEEEDAAELRTYVERWKRWLDEHATDTRSEPR